jgi:hypothetical protein
MAHHRTRLNVELSFFKLNNRIQDWEGGFDIEADSKLSFLYDFFDDQSSDVDKIADTIDDEEEFDYTRLPSEEDLFENEQIDFFVELEIQVDIYSEESSYHTPASYSASFDIISGRVWIPLDPSAGVPFYDPDSISWADHEGWKSTELSQPQLDAFAYEYSDLINRMIENRYGQL